MSYENKEYIIQFFEGVHEEENRAKLIEVYRKAKAFDAISYIIKKRANDDFSSVNNDYEAGILRAYEVMECNVDDFYRGDTGC